jgi:hypothetical protein
MSAVVVLVPSIAPIRDLLGSEALFRGEEPRASAPETVGPGDRWQAAQSAHWPGWQRSKRREATKSVACNGPRFAFQAFADQPRRGCRDSAGLLLACRMSGTRVSMRSRGQ